MIIIDYLQLMSGAGENEMATVNRRSARYPAT